MRIFLKKIAVFIVAIILFLYCYGWFCDWFFLKEEYFPNNSKRYWSMKQKSGVYDYAVLGSSRAQNAFDMLLLDSLINLKGINIGANGSGFVDNYLVFLRFLQNNNSVEQLFLEVDPYSLDFKRNFSNSFHVYNFLPFWNQPEFKSTITNYISSGDSILFDYIPFTKYVKYNKYFSPLEIFRRVSSGRRKSSRLDYKMKSSPAPEKLKVDSSLFFKPKNSKQFYTNRIDVKYLHKIISLAVAKNIKVIFFTAPDFINQENVISNYAAIDLYLQHMIEPYHFPYIVSNSGLRKNILVFQNPEYLNDYGRFLFTKFFSESLLTRGIINR